MHVERAKAFAHRKAVVSLVAESGASNWAGRLTGHFRRLAEQPGAYPSPPRTGCRIRITNARRVFDVVNAALNNTLDPSKELKVK